MAVLAVLIEIVSDANSLVTGELTGAYPLLAANFALTKPISARNPGISRSFGITDNRLHNRPIQIEMPEISALQLNKSPAWGRNRQAAPTSRFRLTPFL